MTNRFCLTNCWGSGIMEKPALWVGAGQAKLPFQKKKEAYASSSFSSSKLIPASFKMSSKLPYNNASLIIKTSCVLFISSLYLNYSMGLTICQAPFLFFYSIPSILRVHLTSRTSFQYSSSQGSWIVPSSKSTK